MMLPLPAIVAWSAPIAGNRLVATPITVTSCIAMSSVPPPPPPPPDAKALPIALALGPLFLSQIIGEQYFVPVYLPLLMFCGAVEGRIDGAPAASTLAASTLLYALGSNFNDQQPGTALVAVNVVACAMLIGVAMRGPAELSSRRAETEAEVYERMVRKAEALAEGTATTAAAAMEPPPASTGEEDLSALRMPAAASGQDASNADDAGLPERLSRGDTALALGLTLGLMLFLTTTMKSVAELRGM